MRGDFSRLTFDSTKHYRRVLMQQGRVDLDADGNEQIAIDSYVAATTSTDVIGQAGYPIGTNADGTPLGGFALGMGVDGKDLTISPGRLYVDGVLVENSDPNASLLAQPDLPGTTLTSLGAGPAGVYSVYLEASERLITALDDPHIRESALGGPDTSVRSKLVWRVLLSYVGPTPIDPSQLPTCASVAEPWGADATTGTLTASSGQSSEPLPCMLPPDSAYGLLENQLYRVEVHTSGADGAATFTWSRENGSVAALITAPAGSIGAPPPTVSGPNFTVVGLNDDQSLGFQAGDWVELADDVNEIDGVGGQLYQVSQVTGAPSEGYTVALLNASAATATLAQHPKLRRWDQRGAALDAGVPLISGAPIELEGGLQVTFSAGQYRAGDYWVIPARTATSIAQGFIDWPTDPNGIALAQPPQGVARHYAKLGLVEFTADSTFAALGTATEPTDCRLPFTPLTGLQPTDVSGPCTIVVQPGPGWEVPIQSWFQQHAASGSATPPSAEICFPVGDFPINETLLIANAGHIRFNGAGWGTRLLATGTAEAVLQFENCASVVVRDLYAETTTVQTPAAGTGRTEHVNGTLSFNACGEVVVEDSWVRCGSDVATRSATCITISSLITDDTATTGTGSARVRGCLLHPGEMQVGIQLVHQARAVIEDNEITVDPRVPSTTLGFRLANPKYLAIARSYLVSGVSSVAGPASPSAPTALTPPAGPAAPAAGPELAPAAPGAATEQAFGTPAENVAENVAEQALIVPTPGQSLAAAVAAPATPFAASGPVAPTDPTREASIWGPARQVDVGHDVGAALASALGRTGLQLRVGNQTLSAVVDRSLSSTWQTYLDANAPTTFATQRDAAIYLKSAANTILTTPAARQGYSAFAGVLRGLQNHEPLAARGISVGGRAITQLSISGNTISNVLMGISVGVSHRPTGTELTSHQRTPDHMVSADIVGNVVGCGANDVANKVSRFGIFVGNVASVRVEDNCVWVTARGISNPPPADGIRVLGYLGDRAIVRGNETSGFSLGIRLVPLVGTGPGTPTTYTVNAVYQTPIRSGPLYLVADNVIDGASESVPVGPWQSSKNPPPTQYIDARGPSMIVDNVAGVSYVSYLKP